ncbi:hypothetical protein [Rhodococcus sp. NPDC058639]|uniref:hypothetical protein n=1 Tax=Rhodococcus sp. NPDC058639 TaxID=3346570 RepID=UPI00365D3036
MTERHSSADYPAVTESVRIVIASSKDRLRNNGDSDATRTHRVPILESLPERVIRSVWVRADEVREPLRAQARAQITSSRDMFERMSSLSEPTGGGYR